MDNIYVMAPGTFLRRGDYRIERVLGRGGFGITYLATDMSLDRLVAIKEFFPADYCNREADTNHVTVATVSNADFISKLKARFLKEARNIAKFDNPGIIRIHAAFEENNTAYYVMDFVHGDSLSGIVKARGPMAPQEALEHIVAVGKALEYVHARQMNHLDVKPANVMVRRMDGAVILIDFGLSKQYDDSGEATSTSVWGISEGFAPMEQYNKGGLNSFSPRTDLYSLAATMYYLLTGTVPPPAAELLEQELYFPPGIPLHYVCAIRRAMSPARKNRQATVGEFIAQLQAFDNPESDYVDVTAVDDAEYEAMKERKPYGSNKSKVNDSRYGGSQNIKSFHNSRGEITNPGAFGEITDPRPDVWNANFVADEPLSDPLPQFDENTKPFRHFNHTTVKRKTRNAGLVLLALVGVVILVLVLMPKSSPGNPNLSGQEGLADVDTTEVATLTAAPYTGAEWVGTYGGGDIWKVDSVEMELPLGRGLYWGWVDSDGVAHSERDQDPKRYSDGVYKILEGDYKGCVYTGEIIHGVLVGRGHYTCANGDEFLGNWRDNEYEWGEYYDKSSNYTFEGGFKNGLPDTKRGEWRKGKPDFVKAGKKSPSFEPNPPTDSKPATDKASNSSPQNKSARAEKVGSISVGYQGKRKEVKVSSYGRNSDNNPASISKGDFPHL